MSVVRRRDVFHWFVCCSLSSVVHLALLIAVALLLLPLNVLTAPLQIDVVRQDEGTELIVLDAFTLADPQEEEALRAPILGDQSGAELEIQDPSAVLAAGKNDRGRDSSMAGLPDGGTGGSGRASFFGTVAPGDRFAYVLDVSPSMNARGGQRKERAVLELLRSIAQLREDQSFYVLVFGFSTRRMFRDRDNEMVPATLENKQRLRAWLANVKTISGTDPRRALQIALEMKPSAVFLLSDGQFNRPSSRSSTRSGVELGDAKVIEVVEATNPGNTPVHTIAFEDPINEKAMDEIAAVTGGEHRFVPAPRPRRMTVAAGVSTRTSLRGGLRFRSAVDSFKFGDEE